MQISRTLRRRLQPILIGLLGLAIAALATATGAQAGDAAGAIDAGGAIDVAGTVDGIYVTDQVTDRAEYAIARADTGLEPNAAGWRPLTFQVMDRGISGDRFLVRFSITNTGPAPRRFVFAHDLAILEIMQVRMTSSAGTGESLTISSLVPFAERPVAYPAPAYRGTVAPGEVQDFTLALDMATPRRLTLGIRLWDEASFETYKSFHQLKFSAIPIVMATMALVWLVVAVTSRQVSLLWYSSYLALLGLSIFLFYGFGYQFLFPERPSLQQLGFQGPMMAAMASALMFSVTYLDLPDRVPWLARVNRSIALVLLAGAVFAVLGGTMWVTVPLMMASLFVPVWSWLGALIVVRQVRTLAVLLFCAAWATMGVTSAVLALQVMFDILPGIWTPSRNYNVVTLVSSVEVMILTISVALSIRNLQQERDRANVAATLDPLTGLLNRRGFQKAAAGLLGTPARGCWCLAVLDLDRFKVINDAFGHAAGDRVLVDFADLLRALVADGDLVCRMGGEEFAILLNASTPAEARALCERIRSRFASEPSRVDDRRVEHCVSIGLAAQDPEEDHGLTLDRMVQHADEALYCAKREGRNRVVLHGDDADPAAGMALDLRLGAGMR